MLFWIILIVVVIVIFYKAYTTDTESGSSQAYSSQKNHSTVTENRSAHSFDVNDPKEINALTNALCCLAAIAGDSHVYVVLQDENPAKNWGKAMQISAMIDNCITTRKEHIPSDIINYLKTVPFDKNTSDNVRYGLEYTFKALPPLPSSFHDSVMTNMKEGTSKSSFVQLGLQKVSINDHGGYIVLDVD